MLYLTTNDYFTLVLYIASLHRPSFYVTLTISLNTIHIYIHSKKTSSVETVSLIQRLQYPQFGYFICYWVYIYISHIAVSSKYFYIAAEEVQKDKIILSFLLHLWLIICSNYHVMQTIQSINYNIYSGSIRITGDLIQKYYIETCSN